jgi:ATP-dependent Lhr-like helicase
MLAPLVERGLGLAAAGPSPGGPALRVLVVSPTRALVNDLFRRLEAPLRRVGVGIAIKTGDSPGFDEQRPPDVLVTTPESLDSLLCRHPRALRDLGAVALDEVQLLDQSARGDQLRCLLRRLDQVALVPPQRCGASAAIPDARRLAATYLGAGARVIEVGRGAASLRRFQVDLAPAATLGEVAARVAELMREGEARKVLCFANARADVEALAAELAAFPPLCERVYAHHGSLARGERLRVESEFRAAPAAVCVATMTLEFGIDIGDVDRVVLVAPPPDVASLLQRVGRSNRREEASRVLALYAGTFERKRLEHLCRSAAAGRLFDDPMPFRPTVIAQQAVSLLFQNPRGWISAEALRERLPESVRAAWSTEDCRQILEALRQARYLAAAPGGRYVADEEGEAAFTRGRIHSMIEDVRETEVVDAMTGRTVGRVRFGKKDQDRLAEGAGVTLALGGRRREATHMRNRRLFVESAPGTGEARFVAREAPRYSSALARDFAAFLGLAPGEMRIEALAKKRWRLYHFLGAAHGRLLGWMLERAGLRRHGEPGQGALSTILRAPIEGPLADALGGEEALRELAPQAQSANVEALARLCGAGPMREVIPAPHLERWVREAVPTGELVTLLARATVAVGSPVADEDDSEAE